MNPGIALVTGGAGFIGSHVVDELLARGHAVRVIDCLHPGAHRARPDYLPSTVEIHHGDLRDAVAVRRALEGVTAVCHLASMVGLGHDFTDVRDYVDHNDVGTASLLAGMAEAGFHGRLVLASSMVVYGEGRYRCDKHGIVRPLSRRPERLAKGEFEPECPRCERPVLPQAVGEDAPVDPRSIYAATKLHQEHLCESYAREVGASLAILRYHNVYGPRMPRDTPYAGVASIFRSALEAGRSPQVFEDGAQIRDFVHVRDVASATVSALIDGADVSGRFNIASGQPHTIGDMAAAMCRAFGAAAPAPIVTGDYRLGDVRHIFASPDRARRLLGFEAGVSFADGVGEFATAPLRASS